LDASDAEDIRKLLRCLFLLRAVLFLSFIVALGATVLVIVPMFSEVAGPSAAGPVAQTTFLNATATASATQTTLITTVTSSTVSFSNTGQQAGYSAISTPTALYSLNYYSFTALISWTIFGATLIWRGHVRSMWGKSRFSYDTFRHLVLILVGFLTDECVAATAYHASDIGYDVLLVRDATATHRNEAHEALIWSLDDMCLKAYATDQVLNKLDGIKTPNRRPFSSRSSLVSAREK